MAVQLTRDAEGYLVDPEGWDREVAAELAREEGIELTDEYWPVIDFIREYYGEHSVIPDIRHVVDYLVKERQMGKKEAKKYLFELFPYGYVKQACKIAGMRRPRAWSTG